MCFDHQENWIDLSRKRVTDIKGNASVTLPKRSKNFEFESRLEVLRVEALNLYRKYMKENCKEKGKQASNLTGKQWRGFISLKKIIENGELLVVPTDKTGKFSIFDRELYEISGLEHTKGDKVVDWNEIKTSQKEINGHVAMLTKIFRKETLIL